MLKLRQVMNRMSSFNRVQMITRQFATTADAAGTGGIDSATANQRLLSVQTTSGAGTATAADTGTGAGTGRRIRIGDVAISLPSTTSATSTTTSTSSPSSIERDRIPRGYHTTEHDAQESLGHMRWILQKQLLKQDLFLLGAPGPARRRLAYRLCELAERETEYLAITRDTTESDLKQRAEVSGGSIRYVDQSPVRSAVHGRVLIVDGIDKAERNVLPTLNSTVLC